MNAHAMTIEGSTSPENVSSKFMSNLLLATAVAGTLDAVAGIIVYDLALKQIPTGQFPYKITPFNVPI